MAFATLTATVLVDASIRVIEGLAVNTRNLRRVYSGRPNTAKYILLMRDRFQVIRVHAECVAAPMVKRQTFRNGTDQMLVHNAMDKQTLTAVTIPALDHSVSAV